MSDGGAQDEDQTLPRTEGERHLPEGKTPSCNGLERSESPDEETLRMLRESGLDPSVPIDPSSLKALQELCTPKRSHGKTIASVPEDTKQPALPSLSTPQTQLAETREQEMSTLREACLSSPHVPSEVLRPVNIRRVTSDLTTTLRSEEMMEEATDASTAGSTRGVDSAEKRILDQLQLQTALLLDLQRRVDELSQIVMRQQGPTAPAPSQQTPRNVYQAENRPPPAQQQPRNAAQPPPPEAAAAAPPARHGMILLPRLGQAYQAVMNIPTHIRSSRVAEIWRVFWALYRRDMGGAIDGNLLFKLMIMALIFMAKFSASNRRKKRTRSNYQLYLALVLIVTGFLVQSGYFRFMYNFFVKEKYPQRIWSGEQIDVAAQPRPARREERRQQQANQQQQQAQDQPGLLRGRIARANAPVGVGRVVMDFVYLIGSFVLSILPMWKAEAIQQEGEQQQQGENNQRQNDEQAPNGGQDGGDNGGN